MRASPNAVVSHDRDLETAEDDDDEPFTPDDPAVVREQNLRALLVLLPAKLMNGVIKSAMEGAMLHTRRTATADAEKRRRLLLSSRAQFRHTTQKTSQGDMKHKDGDGLDDETEAGPAVAGKTFDSAETPDSWRNTTTQERDSIVGHKLNEVLRVLYSTSTEEARVTMRAIYLSSQGIGAAGAQQLAPALKDCVIVALHLGNNALGDKGLISLADGLRHARGLQKLHLNDNEITDVGCHSLANSLGPLKVLSTLDLCHNPFGDKACLSLAIYLSQPGCPLRSLSLAGCLDVDPAAWKTINVRGKDGMGWDPPRPGDDGAVSLAAALVSPHGCPLRRLRMANAGMKTIGAKAIATALCANRTLETVDVSGNDFGSTTDESAWESAADLLSFGLQASCSFRSSLPVHTILLRACGLSREQVLAIQANTSPQITTVGKTRRQEESKEEARSDEGDGGGSMNNPLPWREEKRLGFRAACLREWLLDAARLQGMRYPRPLSPDPNDTTAPVEPNCGGRNGNGSLALVASDDPNVLRTRNSSSYGEDRDRSLVEPQLWSSVMALRRLVASCESGMPLPRGMSNTDHIAVGESASDYRGRQTIRLSQGLETKDEKRSDGGALHRESVDTSAVLDRDGGTTVVTDEARPPTRPNSLTERGRASKSQPRSASKPILSPPISSRESCSRGVNETSLSEIRDNSRRDPSSETLRSAGSEDGELRGDVIENQSEPAVRSSKSETDISVLSGELRYQEGSKGEEGSPGQNVTGGDARAEGQDQWPSGQWSCPSAPTIYSLCGGDTRLIRAADLEAAAEEGRTLGLFALAKSLDMDEEEAALSRERQSLRQQREEFGERTQADVLSLEASLANARDLRNAAGDSVRRLEPIARAARKSERVVEVELRGQQKETETTTCSFVDRVDLERDLQERADHAEGMGNELRGARGRFEAAERRINELEAEERGLRSRLSVYDTTFRKTTADISSAMAVLIAKRNALRRTEKTVVDVASKLRKLAKIASDEEALRAVVPAGSDRRDLDLQVAEAVRITSEAAREVEETKLRRDEAEVALEEARWNLSGRVDMGHGLVLPGSNEATTRARTAPSVGLTADNTRLHGKLSFDHLSSSNERAPVVVEGEPGLRGDTCKDETGAHIPNVTDDGGIHATGGGATNGDGRQQQHARPASSERGETQSGRWEEGAGTERVMPLHADEAWVGAGPIIEATGDKIPNDKMNTNALLAHTQSPMEAEEMRRLSEGYFEANQEHMNAVARRESPHVKRALALIRDHGDIIRLKEKRTPEADMHRDKLVQGRPRSKRRPRGETPLLGVQLNDGIALGAEIAMLRGSGEEDEEGNPILPEIDDRFLTVGQRLRRLRDARNILQREKHRAHMVYSRQMKRNLRERKRFVLAEKRAGRIAKTMDTKQLMEALKERGYETEGSEQLDQLRRVYIEGIQPEIRVRLHATSRWTKSRNKHRERTDTVEVGEIVARRQQLTSSKQATPFSPSPFTRHNVRHAATV
ncbi:unnamed protein product [Ectocarpus fasciculatus]